MTSGLDSGRGRSGALRALAVCGAITVLLSVVALASTSRPGSGSGTLTPHSRTLIIDYLTTLAILAVPLGAILVIGPLVLRRTGRLKPTPTRGGASLLPLPFVLAAVIAGLLLATHHGPLFRHRGRPVTGLRGLTVTARNGRVASKNASRPGQVRFEWLAVLVVFSIVAALAVSIAWAARTRRRPGEDGVVTHALVDVLDDAIEALRGEGDPRRAVIAAYARMEQTLAFHGAPRRPFEAPHEYLERILTEQRASGSSLRRLTALFERAKFSTHSVDPGMQDEAIDALVALRGELQTDLLRVAA